MTDYREIADSEIDQDSPIVQPLMQALRDNTLAAIEQTADDTPYALKEWHPYNGVAIGDGNDGILWDFDEDGAVSSIETDTFVSGYEYRFVFTDVTHSVSSGEDLTLQLYDVLNDTYTPSSGSVLLSFTGGASFTIDGFVDVINPTVTGRGAAIDISVTGYDDAVSNNYGIRRTQTGILTHTNDRTSFSKAKIGIATPTAATFSRGTIRLFKRLSDYG